MTIIEDHFCLAEALLTTLERSGFDARLADTTTSPAALVSAVIQHDPDVVILGSDLDLIGDGTQLVAPIVRAGVAVVVLAGHADDAVRWGMCLSQGATTVVRRTLSLEGFLCLIRGVAAGSFVSPPEEQALLKSVGDPDCAERRQLLQRVARLTSREREILVELTHGRPAAEIAAARFVSEATVRTQIKAVLQKLEVSSQLAAVAVAHKAGGATYRAS